jgi:hypothetical protein
VELEDLKIKTRLTNEKFARLNSIKSGLVTATSKKNKKLPGRFYEFWSTTS